jgi:trimethylamine--corrinoid protein Co-methyltransferase
MLTKIHDASMDILRSVGVAFNSNEARKIFKKAGLKVDGKTVFFSEKDVRKAIDSAPPHFRMAARNKKNSVNIGGDDFALAPGYGASFIVSADGRQRRTIKDDYDKFCKLVQTSELITVCGFLMAEPSDLPRETAHLDMLFSNMLLCDKPFMGCPVSKAGARDSLNMAGLLWGGKDKLKEKPVIISLITPLSPLCYTAETSEAIIEMADCGQALIFGALLMAGATASMKLAGTLVQQNAELLAGITLAQLVTAATIQMAKFYNLPARGGCALTDAHFPDAQAGYESALSLSTAVNAGSNFILHAAGMLGAYAEMSFEKFIIDEELCRLVLASCRPLEVSDDAIDVKMIKEVGIGGEYLSHPTTVELCRNGFFISRIANRQGYAIWHESGSKHINHKATEILHERLNAYEKPDIDPQLEQDLLNYITARKNGGRTAMAK